MAYRLRLLMTHAWTKETTWTSQLSLARRESRGYVFAAKRTERMGETVVQTKV